MRCCAGVVRQALPFGVSQGQPLLLDINNGYLAVLTSNALVRVFKLAAAEAKPHAGPGKPAMPFQLGASRQCLHSLVSSFGSYTHHTDSAEQPSCAIQVCADHRLVLFVVGPMHARRVGPIPT